MTPGTQLAIALLLLLLSSQHSSTHSYHISGLRQTITRNVSAVQLLDDRIMELVEEQTCSAALVRLTCRSLNSFVFILEAEYQPNRTDACVFDRTTWCRYKSLFATIRSLQLRRDFLIGRYTDDEDENPLDFRKTLNRRCSGHHHCRYRVMSDHPEALFWRPANIRIKYACIPEASVYKYCNTQFQVPGGIGGFLKSPGYPLFYLGGITCGWTFISYPGQRIILTFHDLSLREHERDGSCTDVVRVRDDGNTLFESCGSLAGVRIISNTNIVTLNLIASARLYPARGFLLQYQVLGCPDVTAPPGSYISNGTLESRTFLCRAGTLFPDTRQRTRTVHCKNGQWLQRISDLPACVASSAAIGGKSSATEVDPINRLTGSSTEKAGLRIAGIAGAPTVGILDRTTTGAPEVAVETTRASIMDVGQPAVVKDSGDFVVDIILPTVLIALLFVGNAVIVYIIFQYRKRNIDDRFRKTPAELRGEELALSARPNGDSRV